MTDATLPAAVPLRLPPRSAYAAPSSKSSKSTQRLKSSLTYYPIRPFAPLHVCMKDLTADIFQHSAGRLRQRNEKTLPDSIRSACDSKAMQCGSLPRARDGTKTNAANGNRCGVVS